MCYYKVFPLYTNWQFWENEPFGCSWGKSKMHHITGFLIFFDELCWRNWFALSDSQLENRSNPPWKKMFNAVKNLSIWSDTKLAWIL